AGRRRVPLRRRDRPLASLASAHRRRRDSRRPGGLRHRPSCRRRYLARPEPPARRRSRDTLGGESYHARRLGALERPAPRLAVEHRVRTWAWVPQEGPVPGELRTVAGGWHDGGANAVQPPRGQARPGDPAGPARLRVAGRHATRSPMAAPSPAQDPRPLVPRRLDPPRTRRLYRAVLA